MDKKDGYGEFQWASGNSYKGYFKDDERHGRGKMIWTEGANSMSETVYEGDWERGI